MVAGDPEVCWRSYVYHGNGIQGLGYVSDERDAVKGDELREMARNGNVEVKCLPSDWDSSYAGTMRSTRSFIVSALEAVSRCGRWCGRGVEGGVGGV